MGSVSPDNVPRTGLTVALWINTTQQTSDHQSFFCPCTEEDPSSTGNDASYITGITGTKCSWPLHFEIRKHDGNTSGNQDKIRFVARGNTAAPMQTIGDIYTDTAVANDIYGEWHHVAITFDYSSYTMAIWLDGTAVKTTLIPGAIDYLCNNWNYGARVGCNVDDSRQFQGMMDEFYVFDRALSAEEMMTLVNVPVEEYHPGDANKDGKVDDLDASILAANWQRTGDATWDTADFNADGDVDDLDASILAANWQYGVGAAVPEPSTLALLAGGLALLVLARRKG